MVAAVAAGRGCLIHLRRCHPRPYARRKLCVLANARNVRPTSCRRCWCPSSIGGSRFTPNVERYKSCEQTLSSGRAAARCVGLQYPRKRSDWPSLLHALFAGKCGSVYYQRYCWPGPLWQKRRGTSSRTTSAKYCTLPRTGSEDCACAFFINGLPLRSEKEGSPCVCVCVRGADSELAGRVRRRSVFPGRIIRRWREHVSTSARAYVTHT